MAGFSNGKLILDPSSITTSSGENNNVSAMGSLLLVTPANNNDSITGLDPGTNDAALLFIVNIHSSNNLLLKYNSSSSTSGNRIFTYNAANQNLAPYQTALAGYDTVNTRWHIIKFPDNRNFTNNASHTIQTVAASANGFQLSTTRDTDVTYSVTITIAVQIGVATNVGGYVVLEVAATNSATAGDWQEISRVGMSNNIGLALALSSTETVSGSLKGVVPTGYYARLRSVNSNGTPTYAYNSGQEVLL